MANPKLLDYMNFSGISYKSIDAHSLFSDFVEYWTSIEDKILFNNDILEISPAKTYFLYLRHIGVHHHFDECEYRFIARCIAHCMYQHGYYQDKRVYLCDAVREIAVCRTSSIYKK